MIYFVSVNFRVLEINMHLLVWTTNCRLSKNVFKAYPLPANSLWASSLTQQIGRGAYSLQSLSERENSLQISWCVITPWLLPRFFESSPPQINFTQEEAVRIHEVSLLRSSTEPESKGSYFHHTPGDSGRLIKS